MRIRRAVLALLLAVPTLGCGIASVLSTCGPPRPDGLTADDLVGRYAGPHAGTATLNKDGTFEADQLEEPAYSLQGPLPSTPFTALVENSYVPRSKYQSGHGTWQLMERPTIQSDLSLTFVRDDGSKSGWNLEVGGTRAEPFLWYFYGDPDRRRRAQDGQESMTATL